MSGPLILFVMVIYGIISVDQFLRGNMGMGITWAGYSLANIGLYLASR
jgi:hypothetical protein